MATTSTSAFVWLLAGLVAGACGLPAHAQQQQEPQAQHEQPKFALTTTAVVLDVVVRGRGHRPVTDLSVEGFEVFEDGHRGSDGGFTTTTPESDRPRRLRVRVGRPGTTVLVRQAYAPAPSG